MKILVVDNDPTYLGLLTEVLQLHGHVVLTASNGVHALFKLWQEPVDFVLSDISMPKMNGMNLHRYIRLDPKLKHLPFAWNSGYRELRNAVEPDDPNVDLTFDKAMPVADLLALLDHVAVSMRIQSGKASVETTESTEKRPVSEANSI